LIKYIFTFCVCLQLLGAFNCKAQNTIEGTVKDTLGSPVANASVTLLGKDSVTITGFAITNTSGVFLLRAAGNASQLLRISVIGYKTQLKVWRAGQDELEIRLRADPYGLKQVNIRSQNPLIKRGDTLSYNVSEFAKKQDRSIGDVIKNLPGITVNPNGQISYNGRPINRFYIDGDNLLDNKYNLATEAVPADVVDQVQVLENHQPINALNGIIKSDQAALNIKLKNTAKLHVFGTGTFAAGVPKAYEADANMMLFKSKLKFLNTVAFNNQGNDLTYNVEEHTLDELLTQLQLPLNRQLLDIKTIPDPDADRERWLVNKSALVTANTLVKLGKNSSVRVNAYYLPSSYTEQYSSSTTYFLGTGNILQFENQQLHTTIGNFFTSLDYQDNASKTYIDNKLDLKLQNENATGDLSSETGDALQDLHNKRNSVENAFRLIAPISAKLLLELSSNTGYKSFPENLGISPGIYPAALNSDSGYTDTYQALRKTAVYTKNKLLFIVNGSKLKQSYDAGYNFEHASIGSDITLQQNNGLISQLPGTFSNATHWNDNDLNFGANYAYSFQNITLSADIPFDVRHISYDDTIHAGKNRLNDAYFSPSFSLRWNIGQKYILTARESRQVSFGEPEDILPGDIISNYRTIYSNSDVLNRRESENSGISISYRDPISILFITAGLNYSAINNNTITAEQFQPNGLINLDREFYNNNSDRLMLLTAISKYLFPIKGTLRFGINASVNHLDQIENNVLLHVINKTLDLNGDISAKLSKNYNFSYRVDYLIANNYDKGYPAANGTTTDEVAQKLTFTYYLRSNLYFQTANQLQTLRSAQTHSDIFFDDLKFCYTLTKSKTDISLSSLNTFNHRGYVSQSLNLNSSELYSYQFRPRTILLGVRLTF